MALISKHLMTANSLRQQLGLSTETYWMNRTNVRIPTDVNNEVYLEYEGMNGTIAVKQADVVLIDDFLDYNDPYRLANLDYYTVASSLKTGQG